MSTTITFNELRRIKNRLPEGSIHVIADKLNLPVQSVRNSTCRFSRCATILAGQTMSWEPIWASIWSRDLTAGLSCLTTPRSLIWLSVSSRTKTSSNTPCNLSAIWTTRTTTPIG